MGASLPRAAARLGRTLAHGGVAVSSWARFSAVRQLIDDPGSHPIRGRVLCVCDSADAAAVTQITSAIVGDVRVVGMGSSHGDGSPQDAFSAAVTDGPFDAVIDMTGMAEPARVRLFENAFFALRDEGVYVYVHPTPMPPGSPSGQETTVPDVVNEAVAVRRRGEKAMRRAGMAPAERARAVSKVATGPGCIVVIKSGQHLPKLRDTSTNAYLAERRPSSMRVLDTVDPLRHLSNTTVAMHRSTAAKPHFEAAYDVPRLWLREYRDAVVLPGQVAMVDGVVLPDSFRHNLERRLHNKHFVDSTDLYARLRQPVDAAERLDGTYYYLDDEYPSAYGHLLTEQVSRLWGWDDALSEYPDLQILLSAGRNGAKMERTVLGAFGIPPERITVLSRPARVERLVAASPMFQNPFYASPRLLEIWARLRDGFRSQLGPHKRERPARIFVSRPMTGARVCWNTREVEQFFADRGFEVVLPAELSMPDQVDTFASAQIVAGFAGSALINGIYGNGPSKRIIIGHEAYNARNEHLISCLFHDVQHYFWARPDVEHPRGTWSIPAFVSSFTFDLKRAAPYIDDAIGSRDLSSD